MKRQLRRLTAEDRGKIQMQARRIAVLLGVPSRYDSHDAVSQQHTLRQQGTGDFQPTRFPYIQIQFSP